MKLRSDFREAVTIVNRLHRESGEERPGPIPFKVAFVVFFIQYLIVASGMNTGGAHKSKNVSYL